MKILYVIDSLSGGGAEKLIADIVPYIIKDNICEVLLLTLENDKYSEKVKSFGVKVSVVPFTNHFKRLFYIKKYIQHADFDIIHANLFPVIYYCAVCKRLLHSKKIGFVMTEHNTDNRRRHIRWARIIERFVYSSYDQVISISDGTRETLLKWIEPKNKEKYTVVDNGVPLRDIYATKAYLREEFLPQVDSQAVLLCMVGSFTDQKNHGFMIDVMNELPDSYHLVCLGEGPLFEPVKDLVTQNHLSDRVWLLGFRKDTASIMKACDIGVIPSKWEGFGLVAVEEMACGLPIVCSAVAGLSEVVGDAGIKCQLNNVKEFCNSIMSIKEKISSDIPLMQARKFDIAIMVEKLLGIYKTVIGNKK